MLYKTNRELTNLLSSVCSASQGLDDDELKMTAANRYTLYRVSTQMQITSLLKLCSLLFITAFMRTFCKNCQLSS